jgi:hypothetical protein
MRRARIRLKNGPSEALKQLGKKIAKRDGIKPLQPGQTRPYGYYTVDHFTGLSGVPPGAVINIDDAEVD